MEYSKLSLKDLEEKVLSGGYISYEEALSLWAIEDLDNLYSAANRIREELMGQKVDLCTIMNAKSGKCSENCKYCAQSGHYSTGVQEYSLISKEEALKMALENQEAGVHRFSLVTSGKDLPKEDFIKVLEIYKTLRDETTLQLCASHGLLTKEGAEALKSVGITMYHHNLETSRRFFNEICDTHSYDDRIETIKNVLAVGMEVCCGGIIGMGETVEDRFQMAFEIRDLGVLSVPINVLNAIPGTPLEGISPLTPTEILKTMAIYRFILPNAYIRYAGGRKALGSLQNLGFKAGINAALVGNYLTTIGNTISEDIDMITSEGLLV